MAMNSRTVKNLYAQPIKVSLWNGCFNKAVVRHNQYELTVEVTHPLLVWQCGDHKDIMLVKWEGCNGQLMDIPESLNDLVESMKVAATMTDEEARKISEENCESFYQSMKECGIA
jgi:hypothetical protein